MSCVLVLSVPLILLCQDAFHIIQLHSKGVNFYGRHVVFIFRSFEEEKITVELVQPIEFPQNLPSSLLFTNLQYRKDV